MGKSHKTTRNYIMMHLKNAIDLCDKILLQLKLADDLAAGNHPRMTEHLPTFVGAVNELKQALIDFRESI